MKRFAIGVVPLVLAMVPATVLLAQSEGVVERQQRQYEERLREQFDRTAAPLEDRVGVDWGGWFNFSLSMFEDTTDEGRVLRRYDGYLWGRVQIDRGHEFYARGQFSFFDWNTGDSPDHKDDDWYGPRLDRLYYQYDHRTAARYRDKESLDWNVGWKVGRQYVEWGTGLALSMPMDAVQVWAEVFGLEVTGLAGRTIRHRDNIDQSPGVSDSSQRDFYGVQVRYKGLSDHEPFAYYFRQQDHTTEDPENAGQEFDYDSWYVGAGSRGKLFVPNLYYQVEAVYQGGRSYGSGASADQDDIQAWAADARIIWVIPGKHRARIVGEYIYASGDEDRIGSPVSTIGGNAAGSDDKGFNAFGFRNTGMVFAAPISNLQMVRVGGSFRPFPNHRCFRDFVVGMDAFFFLKAENKAAGPESRANRTDANLGQEIDIYFNWRVRSDVYWTVRYGVLFPGDAFSGTRSSRNFLFTGVTFSF